MKKKDPATFVKTNINFLMQKLEINPTELHRKTGVPQPTILRIQSGESEDPKTATLKPIADFFNVTLADFREKDFRTGEIHLAPAAELRRIEEARQSLREMLKEADADLRVITVYRLADERWRSLIDSAVKKVIDGADLTALLHKRK